MPRPGWYNDNEGRDYPFVPAAADALGLPSGSVVDFGCVAGLSSRFEDNASSVYLARVERTGDDVTFEFRSDAPGLAGTPLRFTVPRTAREYASFEAEAGSPSGTCPDAAEPAWEGFLVVGLLGDLFAALADGAALAADPGARVEPALVQNLAKGHVRSVSLANEDRTRTTAADGCPETPNTSLGDLPPYSMIVNRRCMLGPITLREGYNCAIAQDGAANAITISAQVRGGAGEPCGEVPLAEAEAPPDDSTLLTGGPACDEVVTAINGLSASVIYLVPVRGVRIEPATDDPNTLVVNFDMHDLTVCAPDEAIPPG
jgi:hypothetical protein